MSHNHLKAWCFNLPHLPILKYTFQTIHSSFPKPITSRVVTVGSSLHPVDLNYLPNIQQIIQQSPFEVVKRQPIFLGTSPEGRWGSPTIVFLSMPLRALEIWESQVMLGPLPKKNMNFPNASQHQTKLKHNSQRPTCDNKKHDNSPKSPRNRLLPMSCW